MITRLCFYISYL